MVSSSQKIKKRYLGGIAIVVLLILLARVALNDNIAVREYTVRNAYISGDYTFVVLTDLHSTFYGEDQEQLAQKIMEYDPDGVFFGGRYC